MSKDKIRLLVVNEVPLMGDLIASALEDAPDIAAVHEVTTVEMARETAKEYDILLVSPRLPDDGAFQLAQTVRGSAKVVILGLNESRDQVLKYLEVGAAGYISRDETVDTLLDKIRAIHRGRALISPGIAAALISRIAELAQFFSGIQVGVGNPTSLTSREREILELIGRGMTNREIANQLYIQEGTVKNHVHSILQKLNVNSRQDAAAHLAIFRS